MRLPLSPIVPVVLVVAIQAQFTPPPIKDAPATRATETNVPAGRDRDLCVTLPDGSERISGTDTYKYYSNEITAGVFAKQAVSKKWAAACNPSADSMLCPGIEGGQFLHSTFDLEPEDAYHRHACWTFANRSDKAITARLVVHFRLREIKDGYVIFLRKPGDKDPILTSVQSACACSTDGSNVTVYFAGELRPSSTFFAKRGDVIEINAISKTNELGLPDGCHEVTPGKYHVKIQRIYPFDQPADYKSVVVGQIVSERVTDVSSVFDKH